MIIKKRILDKLFNSDLIKKVYPMIDKIDCGVNWDNDETFPSYEIYLDIYLNDPSITEKNMYKKEFDPHFNVGTFGTIEIDDIPIRQGVKQVFSDTTFDFKTYAKNLFDMVSV